MTVALYATRDAALVNSFINDPAIFPFCGFPAGSTWADAADRVRDDDIAFVTDGTTAMMCFHHQPDGWEKHNLFRTTCRGRSAISMGVAMLEWARSSLDAIVIFAVTPLSNRPARWFNRQIGMVSLGVGHTPQFGPVEHFRKDVMCR